MNNEEKVPHHLNIVNVDGDFACGTDQITQFTKQYGLYDKGDKYTVVGIMGCQSSGKSTLLNLVFGTQFAELDSSKGRSMTTRGIWIGDSPNVKDVLVLDLEGTDSSNRGDDRGSFERQSALFALAITEILMINMWHSDIGRFVAANYGILSTIFEVNLQILAHQDKIPSKTMLLFVIRDHSEEDTPAAKITEQLKSDVEKIWEAMNKPNRFKDMKYTDMFDLEFSYFPHKKYKEDEFQSQVATFRKRFIDDKANNYFFKDSIKFKKSVPMESFAKYIENLWTSIRKHKDLNIPSERKMLANFRCSEIERNILNRIPEIVAPLKKRIGRELIPEFGSTLSPIVQQFIKEFDEETSGYDPEVCAFKKEEFLLNIGHEFKALFSEQLSFITGISRKEFQRGLTEAFPPDSETVNDKFSSIVNALTKKTVNFFKKSLDDITVAGMNWGTDTILDGLINDLKEMSSVYRANQLELLKRILVKWLNEEFMNNAKGLLEKCPETLWDELTLLRQRSVEELQNDILNKVLAGFSPSKAESMYFRDFIWKQSQEMLFLEVKSQCIGVKTKMHTRFNEIFRHDKNGLARSWRSSDNVRAIFLECLGKCNRIVELFSEFPVDLPDFVNVTVEDCKDSPYFNTGVITLLDSQQVRNLKIEFRNEVEGAVIQAEMLQERSQSAGVPPWLLLLLVVLGWNEIMSVLSSPLLAMLIILVGAAVFVIYQLDLVEPAKYMGMKLFEQFKKWLLQQLVPSAPKGTQIQMTNMNTNTKKSN